MSLHFTRRAGLGALAAATILPARAQGNAIRISLKMDKINVKADDEIVALIAYLQRLGKDISTAPKDPTAMK